jgi:hypothetical protein
MMRCRADSSARHSNFYRRAWIRHRTSLALLRLPDPRWLPEELAGRKLLAPFDRAAVRSNSQDLWISW